MVRWRPLLACALLLMLFLPYRADAALAASSAGCGQWHLPGSFTFALPSGGLSRSYIIHVPSGYVASTPYPLILNLHAYTSSASGEETVTGMDAEADSQGFLVIYPQGMNGTNGQAGWDVPGAHTDEPSALAGVSWSANDAQYLSDLVAAQEATFCVDPARIAMTGYSMGGIMAFAMACAGTPWLASIEPIAATPPSGAACGTAPYLAFHGEQDTTDRYQGNGANPPLPTILGCGATTWQQADVIEQACAGGSLYSVTDGGHTWPGSSWDWLLALYGLGYTTHTIDASRLIGQFALAHPKQ